MTAKLNLNPGLLEAAKRFGRALDAGFDQADAAASGVTDGFISRQDLEAIVSDESLPRELRTAAKELVRDAQLFDVFDQITAGHPDQQLSRGEIQAVLKASSPEWFHGDLRFKGIDSVNGEALPASKTVEVLRMDASEAVVRYEGKELTLKRGQIERTFAIDEFTQRTEHDEAFLTNDGGYLVKYATPGTGKPQVSLYLELRKPAKDYRVSADFSRTPNSSDFASLDPALSAKSFVGMTTREGDARFAATDDMPVMPHNPGGFVRYDGLELPKAPTRLFDAQH